ncbi:FmdB family zinc ribbon protein [Ferviditalea candida]|uniref:FmdB family zinc ribbon protein n=1 Tax=Ferviditalea candida TaxID=3108399 RepID=A0ABU5ZCA6_9BACL|nr:FmdB family zinc ribbon protein [Paenibacillaceae bacterium T2]
MPVYSFLCGNCGAFDRYRTISESGDPMNCPSCHNPGERIYTAPGIIKTSSALRSRMERGAEGRIVKREAGSQRSQSESGLPAAAKPQFVSGRPWMIGH